MPATSLLLWLALWQASPASLGIEEFQHGNLAAARKHLEQAVADPQATAFLALVRAATGECEAVIPEMTREFGSAQFAETHRLTGLALAQCHVAAKRFRDAAPIVAQLETQFPADADVLYLSAVFHMKAWNDSIYRLYQSAPASFRVDQLSAEVFETQGKLPEAIGEYRKQFKRTGMR